MNLKLKARLVMLIFLILAFFSLVAARCSSPADTPAEVEPGEVSEPVPDPAEEARKLQEEWNRRNEELKEELGQFYVPLYPLEKPENPRVKVKALYLTGHTVAHPRYAEILEMIENSELNAVVIDIKDDHGRMTYHSDIEIVNEIDAYYKPVPIGDIRATLADLRARGIYTIARIVVFKDPYLARQKTEWAIHRKEGGLWTEKGVAWINPYMEEVWDYNIAIAKEAALLGFNEIQFDYIRFPENAARVDREATYYNQNGRSKDEAIAGFLKKARQELADYNVYIAYDVFGVIATSWGDHDNIGQIWETFTREADYICPMIYPSHYGKGYFGFAVPDANPGGTITRALTDALKRNAAVKNPAIIRPWLQSFTATWIEGHIPYGPAEVRRQIDAALALGIDEFMIWNPDNVYQAGSFLTDAEAEQRAEAVRRERESKGHDFLGRSAREAVEAYLEAIKNKDWREAYALQSGGFTVDGNRYRDWLNGASGRLAAWTVRPGGQNGDTATMELELTVTLGGEEITLEGEKWTARQENNVWRIEPSARFLELLEGSQGGGGEEEK
ncbi:MAG TPA: putative glycoside hydrolase [Bacillota bacterium]|nr:putative glycoside hydrolase [Bacillota bacterium]